MKIVVIGGTGLIGTQVVNFLQQLNHEVIAASPKNGVNTITREGLANALSNANVVVDVSASPAFDDDSVMNFFTTSAQNILAAEVESDVKHHILLSVVGTDLLQKSGYFRAKLAQEQVVENGPIHFTIIRATQFFEFANSIVQMGIQNKKVVVPDANIQPIASKEVAEFIGKVCLDTPTNGKVEIAGPEQFRIQDWIREYVRETGKDLNVQSDAAALFAGASISKETLVCHNPAQIGNTLYRDWIKHPDNRK